MKYPPFITASDTIGFVAPSFGCNTEPYKSAFDNAQKILKEKGHGLDPGPNVYAGTGTGISASPESCGQELTAGYLSKQNQALISCGGGELMCEILDYVDFDAIRRADPKWYMGYSDNTNFTFLLNTLCDTASIYGPNAPAFGMEPWHASVEDAYALLKGEKTRFSGYPAFETESLKDETHPLAPYNLTNPRKIRAYVPGTAAGRTTGAGTAGGGSGAAAMELASEPVSFSGRLVGGCMDCLVNLTGTRYDRVREFKERYQEDGIIWFLESCDLSVFAIRRAIWQMIHAGWFEHSKGFLIGRPFCHGQVMMGLDQYRAVTELLSAFNVPVVMDLDIGHLPPMMPVVGGTRARVEVKGQDFGLELDFS